MEWWLILLIVFGSLIILMASGMPVAFCFMTLNVVGVILLMGGEVGLRQLGLSMFSSAGFAFLPMPLFILMGEVLFYSGIAKILIDVMDMWLGRLPGRLALMAVTAGTLFATLTGSSLGSTAMLGSTLVPEMEKRGYKKPMSLGPIIGSGGLAIMIPPSGLAVFLAAVGEISIGQTLMAIVMPGLLMALLYAGYIVIRCWIQPEIAAPYEVGTQPLGEKLKVSVRYVLPVGFIVFLVIGLIFLGIATPTESAAAGAMGTFILSAFYRKLTWDVCKKAISSSMVITSMIFMIIVGARAYSQILAFSGASRGLIKFATELPVDPIVIIIGFLLVLLLLGMFITASANIMVAAPLVIPVVKALGFEGAWFAAMFLLTLEMGASSPPFGVINFIMKGVAPPDTTMAQIYRAGLPFLFCDALAIALILIFPALALWLPRIMR